MKNTQNYIYKNLYMNYNTNSYNGFLTNSILNSQNRYIPSFGKLNPLNLSTSLSQDALQIQHPAVSMQSVKKKGASLTTGIKCAISLKTFPKTSIPSFKDFYTHALISDTVSFGSKIKPLEIKTDDIKPKRTAFEELTDAEFEAMIPQVTAKINNNAFLKEKLNKLELNKESIQVAKAIINNCSAWLDPSKSKYTKNFADMAKRIINNSATQESALARIEIINGIKENCSEWLDTTKSKFNKSFADNVGWIVYWTDSPDCTKARIDTINHIKNNCSAWLDSKSSKYNKNFADRVGWIISNSQNYQKAKARIDVMNCIKDNCSAWLDSKSSKYNKNFADRVAGIINNSATAENTKAKTDTINYIKDNYSKWLSPKSPKYNENFADNVGWIIYWTDSPDCTKARIDIMDHIKDKCSEWLNPTKSIYNKNFADKVGGIISQSDMPKVAEAKIEAMNKLAKNEELLSNPEFNAGKFILNTTTENAPFATQLLTTKGLEGKFYNYLLNSLVIKDGSVNNGKVDEKKVKDYTNLLQNSSIIDFVVSSINSGTDMDTVAFLAKTQKKLNAEIADTKTQTSKHIDIADKNLEEVYEVFISNGLNDTETKAILESITKEGVINLKLQNQALELIKQGIEFDKIGDILKNAQITGEYKQKIIDDFVSLQELHLNPLLEKNLAVLNSITNTETVLNFNSKVRKQLQGMISGLSDETKTALANKNINLDQISKNLEMKIVQSSDNVPKKVKVKSGLRSKQSINGFERIVVDKYNPDEHIWRNENATRQWAEEKYNTIINGDYKPRIYLDANTPRENGLKEWAEFMNSEPKIKNNPFAKIILAEYITRDLTPENADIPPQLDKKLAKEILTAANDNTKDVNFANLYAEKIREKAMKGSKNEQVEVDGIKGTWYTVPKTDKSNPDYKTNVDKVKAFSDGTNWCIRTYMADPYVEQGAMHFFVDENGLTQICIRENTPLSVFEIQKRQQNATVPIAYINVIDSYMKNNGLTAQNECKNRISKAKAAKPEFDNLRNKFRELSKKQDYKSILEAIGIKVQVNPDRTFTLSHYTPELKGFTLSDLGIKENELLANVKRIDGDATFTNSNASTLPLLEEVTGTFTFKDSNLSFLPNLKSINGYKIKWDVPKKNDVISGTVLPELEVVAEKATTISERLNTADSRDAFAKLRDEIKEMPNDPKKQALVNEYQVKYREWSTKPDRPDIRMEYKQEKISFRALSDADLQKAIADRNFTEPEKTKLMNLATTDAKKKVLTILINKTKKNNKGKLVPRFSKSDIETLLEARTKDNAQLMNDLIKATDNHGNPRFDRRDITELLRLRTPKNASFMDELIQATDNHGNPRFDRYEILNLSEVRTKDNALLMNELIKATDKEGTPRFDRYGILNLLGVRTKNNVPFMINLIGLTKKDGNPRFSRNDIIKLSIAKTKYDATFMMKLIDLTDNDKNPRFDRYGVLDLLEVRTKDNSQLMNDLIKATDNDGNLVFNRFNILNLIDIYPKSPNVIDKLLKNKNFIRILKYVDEYTIKILENPQMFNKSNIQKLDYMKKTCMNSPERYVNGIYPDSGELQNAVKLFFTKNYVNLLPLVATYDKEVLNNMLRLRFNEVEKYTDIVEDFNFKELELLSKLSASQNIDGKPFMTKQKIEFIDLINGYKKNRLDTSKMETMIKSDRIDLAQLNMDLFNKIMKNSGLTDKEIASIPKDKLVAWDIKYIHLLSKEINKEKCIAFSDILRAGNLEPDFNKYIHDTTNVYGQANAKTKTQYDEFNLKYDSWLKPSKNNEVHFVSYDANTEQLSQIEALVIEDMNILMQTPVKNFLKKQFPKFIKNEEFIIPNEYLSNKNKLEKLIKILADESEQGQLSGVWVRARNNINNPNHSAMANITLKVLNNLKQRINDLDKIKNVKMGKTLDWTIKMWDRNPQKDIFQGNYSTCCIEMGGLNGSAMPHYLMNTAYNMIELIDNITGETVGNALCYFIKRENGKPAFIIDNIEINNGAKPTTEIGLQLRDSIVKYVTNVAKEVTGKDDTPIYMSMRNNDVYCEDLPVHEETISFIGDIDCDEIYMDLYKSWVAKYNFTSRQNLAKLK